jgi:hypothetical protein
MLHAYRLGTGTWWRFSAYEIRNGYIQPVHGAKLRAYDPWEEFDHSRDPAQSGSNPYAGLVELVRLLDPVPNPRPIVDGVLSIDPAVDFATPLQLMTPEVSRAILGWCGEYGLLGLLLHRVRAVRLGYRVERRGRHIEVIGSKLFYANHTWQKVSSGFDKSELKFVPQRESISLEALPDHWPRPSVVARMPLSYDSIPDHISEPMWREESLSTVWTHYFPTVPAVKRESFDYPVPTSPAFWELYAEPVDEFVYAALVLSRALVSAAQITRYRASATTSEPRDPFGELNELVDRCSLCLEEGPDSTLRHRCASPSLIDKLAMMAVLDLGEGRQAVGRCLECGGLYAAAHHRRTYCSKRCQGNKATRDYRRRLREPRAQRRAKRRR